MINQFLLLKKPCKFWYFMKNLTCFQNISIRIRNQSQKIPLKTINFSHVSEPKQYFTKIWRKKRKKKFRSPSLYTGQTDSNYKCPLVSNYNKERKPTDKASILPNNYIPRFPILPKPIHNSLTDFINAFRFWELRTCVTICQGPNKGNYIHPYINRFFLLVALCDDYIVLGIIIGRRQEATLFIGYFLEAGSWTVCIMHGSVSFVASLPGGGKINLRWRIFGNEMEIWPIISTG